MQPRRITAFHPDQCDQLLGPNPDIQLLTQNPRSFENYYEPELDLSQSSDHDSSDFEEDSESDDMNSDDMNSEATIYPQHSQTPPEHSQQAYAAAPVLNGLALYFESQAQAASQQNPTLSQPTSSTQPTQNPQERQHHNFN